MGVGEISPLPLPAVPAPRPLPLPLIALAPQANDRDKHERSNTHPANTTHMHPSLSMLTKSCMYTYVDTQMYVYPNYVFEEMDIHRKR